MAVDLSRNVFTAKEIKVLEKGHDFPQTQKKLNESKLQRNFKEICCRRTLNWCILRKEDTTYFVEQPFFSPKSSWSLPAGHPNL